MLETMRGQARWERCVEPIPFLKNQQGVQELQHVPDYCVKMISRVRDIFICTSFWFCKQYGIEGKAGWVFSLSPTLVYLYTVILFVLPAHCFLLCCTVP